jgi:hypothetical protein
MTIRPKIFISGRISGTNDYMERFAHAEEFLKNQNSNNIVINPTKVTATLPHSSWEEYMDVTLPLLKQCNTVYMLRDWEYSYGARIENTWAKATGKAITYEREEDAYCGDSEEELE